MAEKGTKGAEKKLIDSVKSLREQGFGTKEILEIVRKSIKAEEKPIEIPASIFNNDGLSALETIVKFLRENLELSFREISQLTGRNDIPLRITYNNSRKKLSQRFSELDSKYLIPISLLKNKKLSVLENIVSFLKEEFSLSLHQIALILNRDDRTIWTVHSRAKKKRSVR